MGHVSLGLQRKTRMTPEIQRNNPMFLELPSPKHHFLASIRQIVGGKGGKHPTTRL